MQIRAEDKNQNVGIMWTRKKTNTEIPRAADVTNSHMKTKMNRQIKCTMHIKKRGRIEILALYRENTGQ